MSTLIIDAGSTKMEWAVLENKKVIDRYATPGFNPNYVSIKVLEEALNRDFPTVEAVYYYGTGCGLPKNCRRISDVFRKRFPEAEVVVNHDLTGAERPTGRCMHPGHGRQFLPLRRGESRRTCRVVGLSGG